MRACFPTPSPEWHIISRFSFGIDFKPDLDPLGSIWLFTITSKRSGRNNHRCSCSESWQCSQMDVWKSEPFMAKTSYTSLCPTLCGNRLAVNMRLQRLYEDKDSAKTKKDLPRANNTPLPWLPNVGSLGLTHTGTCKWRSTCYFEQGLQALFS